MHWLHDRDRSREFDDFVRATTDRLYKAAFMITWDEAEAEDAVQEAFTKVAQRWPRVRTMEHPQAYAQRVVVNHVLKLARRSARHRDELRPFPHDAALDRTAAAAIDRVDDTDRLRQALAGLTERQRTVLVLRYWADFSEADVAAVLGCSKGNVKSTASRAAGQMAAALRVEGACSNDSSRSPTFEEMVK